MPSKTKDANKASQGEDYTPPMTPDRRKFLEGMAGSQKKAAARSEEISRKDKEQLYEVAPAPPTYRNYKSGGTVRGKGCESKGFGKGRFV